MRFKFRAWDRNNQRMSDWEEWLLEEAATLELFFNDEWFDVMQFTGACDKNDVEIYEGDIIKFGEIYAVAEWSYKDSAFILSCSVSCPVDLEFNPYTAKFHYEVVGNVYEDNNSGLMEQLNYEY